MVNPVAPTGSYAEYVSVDYRQVARLPSTGRQEEVGNDDGLLKAAASLPLSGCTAYESLAKVGLLRSVMADDGEVGRPKSLLIVGGAGGVGSWATLLART